MNRKEQQHRAAMAVYEEIRTLHRLRKAAGRRYSPAESNIIRSQRDRIAAMKLILLICGVFYDREELAEAVRRCRHEKGSGADRI